MTKANIIILICSTMVFLIILLFVFYMYYKNKLKDLIFKLIDSDNSIIKMLKDKHENVLRLVNIVENKFKIESKIFDDVKNIKQDKIAFKSDIILSNCYNEIIKIKEDRNKTRELKSFRDTLNEYNDIELHIISLRTYYNKNVMELNNSLKKFPYSIIGKLNKIKSKLLFEGKELEDITD